MKKKLDKIPYDTTDLLTAKAIIQKLGINGEIDFISQNQDRIYQNPGTILDTGKERFFKGFNMR